MLLQKCHNSTQTFYQKINLLLFIFGLFQQTTFKFQQQIYVNMSIQYTGAGI